VLNDGKFSVSSVEGNLRNENGSFRASKIEFTGSALASDWGPITDCLSLTEHLQAVESGHLDELGVNGFESHLWPQAEDNNQVPGTSLDLHTSNHCELPSIRSHAAPKFK
jgi:hypothetical protein